MNIVILAGGVGQRLWPLGRRSNPKQFFPVVTKKPLARETYERFVKTYGPSRIYFSTTAELLPYLKKLFPRTLASHFIVEPCRRDTGPAMGFVAARLLAIAPDEPMVFAPSDHFITDPAKYLRCFQAGAELIKKTGKLLDIGITATFPSTVLGYTKIGKKYGVLAGVKVYHFAGHTEKPDYATAKKYLANGHYLWHGNYYMWTPRLFLETFKKYAPDLYQPLMEIQKLTTQNQSKKIAALYGSLPKISFDYAITEKIRHQDVLIIKGDFGWSDIGAWDVLHHQLQGMADKRGNVTRGQVAHHDTQGCLLYGHGQRVLATLGLRDTVVVDTADAVLVCSKEKSQEVKKILEEMEKKGWSEYL